jgi:uncharacterized circularly permuted ATP-grasp superfamily protein
MDFKYYDPEDFYDELFKSKGKPRPGTKILINRLKSFPKGEILRRQKAAEAALFNMGVTFTVYSDESGIEKIFPFDLLPRIVEPGDWDLIEKGLKQRICALNLFIDDVYHDQKIIKDGVIPKDILYSSKCFQPKCVGLNPPKGIWCHITGTDLVRDRDGRFYVLEDNLRCPSGVSYVLENRQVLKRTFPLVFEQSNIRPVDDYPDRLLRMLQYLAPENVESPTIGLLTPGIHNSAYFEHSFLAQQTGIELVEGNDLAVMDGYVYMRTTSGFQKVDVLYRRIDDDFLDPLAFNPDSLLGVSGIMDVYSSGGLALANAPGTGVADDKVVYAYVPKIIKYYMDEDPILPNVPTYVCWDEKDREYVLKNLEKLVVKPANESGGYGMLMGTHSTDKQRKKFAKKIKKNPRNYIAQPTLSLSRVPVIVDDNHFEGRHVDLRPYVLYGEDIYVMPGGLTRVALKKG